MYLGKITRWYRGDNPVDSAFDFDSGIMLDMDYGSAYGTAVLDCEGRKLVFNVVGCRDVFDAFSQIITAYHALPPPVREEFIWGEGGMEGYRRSLYAKNLRQILDSPAPKHDASYDCVHIPSKSGI